MLVERAGEQVIRDEYGYVVMTDLMSEIGCRKRFAPKV
jgi:hypothetical protein